MIGIAAGEGAKPQFSEGWLQMSGENVRDQEKPTDPPPTSPPRPSSSQPNLIAWAGGPRATLAVVFTDIVGSTSLRGRLKDERMSEMLRAHFAQGDALLAEHGGRRVKTIGDGLMALFRSAGAALDFARRLQANPGPQELRIRAGIHVGEIDIEADDVAGMEVHVAARATEAIKGSRICLTARAKSDVDRLGARHHRSLSWEHRESVAFKGLEGHRFTLWLLRESSDVSSVTPTNLPQSRPPRKTRGPHPVVRPASDGRPAIAVLPFVNLSDIPDQSHFSDGIADDLINELARCRMFPVISRNSSFTFKNRDIEITEIGRKLGAGYIVEGSFNRIAQRARISARLIDAITGVQMAAERFDRDFDELPHVQDEITEMIVGSLAPELLRVEQLRVAQKKRKNPTSYECFLRGLEAHYRYTKIDNAAAQRHFRAAIEADERNAQAHALLAHAILHAVQLGWREDDEHNYSVADHHALRAIALDARAPFAHFALGSTSMFLGRIDQALREMRETVRINPSHAAAYAIMAHLLCYVEQPDHALNSVQHALRLSPYDPRLGLWLAAQSQAHYFLGAYQEAATIGQQALFLIEQNPIAQRFTAASLGQLGRVAEAEPLIAVLRKSPAPSIEAIRGSVTRLYRNADMIEHMIDGLRKAGLN